MDRRIELVIAEMEAHVSERMTLSELASLAHLSPSRLRHLFKQETGMTPANYLRKVRLDQAEELLRTTFLSVKEIAGAVGFSTAGNLLRAFKKAYGKLPTTYRITIISNQPRRTK
jgi:transcriptional regulator GlxA family with amidase domain